MIEASEAVDQLINVHLVWHDGNTREAEPLLEQLRDARHASIGAGGTRGGGEGSMINYAAYDLWEEIDGQVRAWLNEYRRPHVGDLAPLLPQALDTIKAEHTGNRLDDETAERMYKMFPDWAQRIRDLIDPPPVKELTEPCPDCGMRYEETITREKRNGVWKDITTYRAAVRIPIRIGYALIAECHCCGKLWAGKDQLIELGEAIGSDINFAAIIELASLVPTTDKN